MLRNLNCLLMQDGRCRRRRGCSTQQSTLCTSHITILSLYAFVFPGVYHHLYYRVPLRGQILHIRCCTDTYRHNSLHIFILKGPVFDIYHLCSFFLALFLLLFAVLNFSSSSSVYRSSGVMLVFKLLHYHFSKAKLNCTD